MSSQAAPFQPHPDPYHEKSVHSLSVGDSVHHRVSRLFTFRHTRSCRADRGSVDVRGRNHGRLSPHHLSVIAHDSLEGRATGMRGQKIAADYLADFYDDLGFTPAGDGGTYFQNFELAAEQTDSLVYYTWKVEEGDTLLVDHSVLAPGQESDYLQIFGGTRPLRGEIVFAGFGE